MVEKTIETLGDALPREIARVRDEVLPAYLKTDGACAFGVAMIRKDLDDAARAMVTGDVVSMIRVYESLKEYKR